MVCGPDVAQQLQPAQEKHDSPRPRRHESEEVHLVPFHLNGNAGQVSDQERYRLSGRHRPLQPCAGTDSGHTCGSMAQQQGQKRRCLAAAGRGLGDSQHGSA